MSAKQFYEDLKNKQLGSSIYLYGQEDFLIKWAKDLIVSEYVTDENRGYDVVEINGSTCTAAEISQATRAYSMFSEKRIVIVENYISLYKKSETEQSADDDAILSIAAEAQDNAILIFTLEGRYYEQLKAYSKKLAKACSSYEFNKLDRVELRNWINKHIHTFGKNIGRRELEYLIDLSGYCYKKSDYYLKDIYADITRMCYASESDNISIDLIEDIMIGAEEKFVFALVDALTSGNKSRAMEIATTIVGEDDGAMGTIGLLTKQFEIMYDALELDAAGMSIKQMATATSINEYRFKKAYQAARRFGQDRIRELLIRLYDIDKNLKTGNMDINTAFELFIVSA